MDNQLLAYRDYPIVILTMAKVVAVIGASNDRSKFGNRAVRAYLRQGYTVIPINPHENEVEGLKAYKSVLDVPGTIDMASFYVPPDVGEQVMDEVAKKGDRRGVAEPRRRKRSSDPSRAGAAHRADHRLQHRRHRPGSLRILKPSTLRSAR